jgi:S1/P1 Nuclease
MRTFRLAAASLTLMCAIAAADRASAWGDLGHKIVFEIAFQELNDPARQDVRRLIRRDPEFTLFSHACTWLVLQTSTNDDAKLAALKFLGHWLGDHQPLHVSFEDDRSGGKIKESGPCSNNLHSV